MVIDVIIDKDYFTAIYNLSKPSKEEVFHEAVYVSEITYCSVRRERAIFPAMTLGIERDKGIKALLYTESHDELVEAYFKGDMATVEKLAKELKEIQGTEKVIFVTPSRELRLLRRKISAEGKEIEIVGAPDFFAMNLEPLRFGNYEISPFSLLPIEKKTGKKDFRKFRIGLEQAMIYAWLMDAPAFIIQSDWARYENGDVYVISNDFFVFLPKFDEEVRKSFEKRLFKRAFAVMEAKRAGRITWYRECEAIPLAGLGVYAIKMKSNGGKRKGEEEIFSGLMKIGERIAREDGLRLVDLSEEAEEKRELTPGEIRKLVVNVVQRLSEISNATIVPWRDFVKATAGVVECLERKGWDVARQVRDALRDEDSALAFVSDLLRKDGVIEIYESGLELIKDVSWKVERDVEECINRVL